tara:strand:- start:6352 stop:13512 length:7161 start_codon:yes stop_codon:yes gene_type:complete
MEALEFIDLIKQKYPTYAKMLGEDNEQAIYDMGMLLEGQKNQQYIHDVKSYADVAKADDELSHSFMSNIGSYGVDLTNWGDTVQNAYNNSIIGLYEQSQTGELPYEVGDLNMFQEAASFVMSMFMPADLASFGVGGKIASTIAKPFVGKALRKNLYKNLSKGYKQVGHTPKDAAAKARSWSNHYITNKASNFIKPGKVMHPFVGPQGQRVSRELWDGKNIAEAWALNANHLGGQLAAHRAVGEAMNIMIERQGEGLDPKLQMDDLGRIGKSAAKAWTTGIAVGGVKAIAGTPLVKGIDDKLVKVGEFGAESVVFASTEPILFEQRIPDWEEIKHSAFNLAAIKATGRALGGAAQWYNQRKIDKINYYDKLTKERENYEKIIQDIEDPKLRREAKKQTAELDKELETLKIERDMWGEGVPAFIELQQILEKVEKKHPELKGKELLEKLFTAKESKHITPEFISRLEGELGESKSGGAQGSALERSIHNINLELSKKNMKPDKEFKEIRDNYIPQIRSFIKILKTNPEFSRKASNTPEADISTIKREMRDYKDGGTDWTYAELWESGLVKHVTNDLGKDLYYTKTGKQTTRNTGEPVMEFIDNAKKEQFLSSVRDRKAKWDKAVGKDNINTFTEQFVSKFEEDRKQIKSLDEVLNRDFGEGSIGQRNKEILGAFAVRFGTETLDSKTSLVRASKLLAMQKWAKWLQKNKNVDIVGNGAISSGEMQRWFYQEFLPPIKGKEGLPIKYRGRDDLRGYLHTFYEGAKNQSLLKKYMRDGETPILGAKLAKTLEDAIAEIKRTVKFRQRELAGYMINDHLSKKPNESPGSLSKKWGVKNSDLKLWYALAMATGARPNDIAYFNWGELTPVRKSGKVVDYIIKFNQSKSKRPSLVDKNAKSGSLVEMIKSDMEYVAKRSPEVWQKEFKKTRGSYNEYLKTYTNDIIQALVAAEIKAPASGWVFPSIYKYATNNSKNLTGTSKEITGNLKNLLLEINKDLDPRAKAFYFFDKDLPTTDKNVKIPQGFPFIVEPGDKSPFSNIFRHDVKEKYAGNFEAAQERLGHANLGNLDFYLAKELGQKPEKARVLSGWIKEQLKKGTITTAQSKFLQDKLKMDDVLTRETFNEFKGKFGPKYPYAEYLETKLPKDTLAQVEFRMTKNAIGVELGKSTITSLFHEHGEIMFDHAMLYKRTKGKTGDKLLHDIYVNGIKKIKSESNKEWEAQGFDKVPMKKRTKGYRTPEEFQKEWFLEKVAMLNKGYYVNPSIANKVKRFMKEMYSEFRRYWLGIESNNLSLEDYIMLAGRRQWKGINALESIKYRTKGGKVAYSKLSNKKNELDSVRNTLLESVETEARKFGLSSKEIFDKLQWKEKFGIKSWGEIDTKDKATLAISDMRNNLKQHEIKNDYFHAETIKYNTEQIQGSWVGTGVIVNQLKKLGVYWGGLGGFKTGEYAQYYLEPGVMMMTFAPKSLGTHLYKKFYQPFVMHHQRYQGYISKLDKEINSILEAHKGKSALIKEEKLPGEGYKDAIAVMDSNVLGTNLTKKQKEFKENWKNNPDGMEGQMIQSVRDYYDAWWKLKDEVIDRNVAKGTFTKRQGQFLKDKLNKKYIKGYLTHSRNPKFKEFLNSTGEGRSMLNDLAKEELFKKISKEDKQYKTLLGENSKLKSQANKGNLSDAEMLKNSERQAEVRNQLNKRFEAYIKETVKETSKEGKEIVETRLEKEMKKKRAAALFSDDYIFSPNLEFERIKFEEFYEIKDPTLFGQYGEKYINKEGKEAYGIRVNDTSYGGTVVAYGRRMANTLSALEHTPEFLGLARKGKEGYKATPLQDLIDRIELELPSKDRGFAGYLRDVFNVQLGLDHSATPTSRFGKRMMELSQFSAGFGLSSPFSGAKNVVLGDAAIVSIYGTEAWKKGWERVLSGDVELEALGLQVGAKEVGQTALREIGAKKLISTLGFMTETEWANRKRAIAASLFYVEDGFNKLSGRETTWFKGEAVTFSDRMRNQFHFTEEMMAVGRKYGTDKANVPSGLKNAKKIKALQNEMNLRTAQYGHQITQGATGVANLPLWMNKSMLGKWSTVFHRIAFNMTTNYKRNIMDPLIKFNNPMPLLRYSASHLVGGYALFQLSDWILGQGNVYEMFDDDTEKNNFINKMWEYGRRAEFGAGLGTIINVGTAVGRGDYFLDGLGVVNYRNMSEIASNILSVYNKEKYVGQAVEDIIKTSIVLANHAERAFYKRVNPHLTNHKKVRKALDTFAENNDLKHKFVGQGGGGNERSPIYRKLRHAFMIGEAEGQDGYISTYIAAFDFIRMQEYKRRPELGWSHAGKKAREAIVSKIKSFDPVYFSENSVQGQRDTKAFFNSLKPSERYLVRRTVADYKKKVRQFWTDVNAFDKKNRFTSY